MTEREQVIAELLYLKHDCLEGSATDKTLDKAIALLKAQEPMVMTLEEVKALCESTPVWLEDVDKRHIIGGLFVKDYTGTQCFDFVIVRDWNFDIITANYSDYGVRWRCWTSRPTDEQMGETQWE